MRPNGISDELARLRDMLDALEAAAYRAGLESTLNHGSTPYVEAMSICRGRHTALLAEITGLLYALALPCPYAGPETPSTEPGDPRTSRP
jgi:hypothetical protein